MSNNLDMKPTKAYLTQLKEMYLGKGLSNKSHPANEL